MNERVTDLRRLWSIKKRTFAKRQWYRCQGQEASGKWSLEVSLAAQVQVAPLCLAHHPFLWSPPPSLLSPPPLLLPADSAFLLAPQSHLEAALKPGWRKNKWIFWTLAPTTSTPVVSWLVRDNFGSLLSVSSLYSVPAHRRWLALSWTKKWSSTRWTSRSWWWPKRWLTRRPWWLWTIHNLYLLWKVYEDK